MSRVNRELHSGKYRRPSVHGVEAKARKTTAVAAIRQAKSHTWVRPEAVNKAPDGIVPDRTAVPGADAPSRSFLSDSQASTQTVFGAEAPQQGLYISRKRNALTRLSTVASSQSTAELKPAESASSQVTRETRRLIHQGRYKLVQGSSKDSSQQHRHLSSRRPVHAPTALQQYRRFVRAQNRKRAGQSLAAPAAKKANTWVRNVAVPRPLQNAEGKNSLTSACTSYVRSYGNHKLQLVRERCVPATPVARLQSRGTVLAKQLLSVRSLKRTRHCLSTVKSPCISKPGRLQRIDGVLYKVGGSRHGRSLQRQVTPKGVRPLLSPEGGYVRQGRHLILKSTLKSTLKSPRVVASRVSTARSGNAAAAARATARQKLVVPSRRPSRLRRGSQSAQTHCLVYCRTGQCREQQAGKCSLVHEQTAVAVCPRWLQGSCSNASCLLQHCRCPDVMPVCTFYLQGLCTTEDCPYSHVKVDPNAPVCQEFVAGHCPRGVACTKKHLTPRMIRQLRQSKALQADALAERGGCIAEEDTASDAGDEELRPSFLR